MQIPTLSIIFMAVSALLAVGTPIALIVVFRKRYKLQAVPVFAGAAVFVVFALFLEVLVHNIVLRPGSDSYNAISLSPVLYMLYSGFMAGIFEETGRFVCFKILKYRYSGIKTALGYGIGHGGIEAVLLVGVSMITSVISFISLNALGAEQLASETAASAEVLQAIATVAAVPPVQFLTGGIERLFAIAIQISLSVFVFYAAYDNARWQLFPLAILLHAVIDFIPGLYQSGALGQGGWAMFIMEAIVGLYAALLVFLAVRLHRRLRPESLKTDITSDIQL